jgi:hypothetical protein
MESSDVTTAEDTQQGTSPEYVDLPDATDEDISAFLENAGREESVATVAPQQTDPAQHQTKAEPPKEEPEVEQETVSKQDFEAMKRKLEGQELLIKRRTSEIGEIKRQLQQFIQNTAQSLDEKFYESPTQALQQARQLEMAQQKLQEAEAEEQSLTNAHQAQVLLAHHVGGDIDIEAIGESLRSDGMPPEFVEQFQRNPYQAALPETLIQLAKRASAEKQVRQMQEALQQLVPYTQKLLEERKQLPQHVLKNVSSALRQAPQVTGSAGGTGQLGGNRAVDPSLMSDAELAEFLKS